MDSIILASASPRRRELLDQIGVRYDVKAVDVDESALPDENAVDLVVRLACLKAETAYQRFQAKVPVLGSDTLGLLNGEILTKPTNFQHASDMLTKMSGTTHEILSAVAVCYQGKTDWRLSRSQVSFRTLSTQDIKRYWDSGEPQDKAGAYAIQGLGAVFIQEIKGSYSGIMGLPLKETWELLNEYGVQQGL